MKCQNCPLYKIDYDFYTYDFCEFNEYCLADLENQDFPKGVRPETGGCQRSDKWILSQDPGFLEIKHLRNCIAQKLFENFKKT